MADEPATTEEETGAAAESVGDDTEPTQETPAAATSGEVEMQEGTNNTPAIQSALVERDEEKPLRSDDEAEADEAESEGPSEVPTGAKKTDKPLELAASAPRNGSASASTREEVKYVKLADWYIRYPCRMILGILVVFIIVVFIDSLEFELITNTEHGYYVNSSKRTHREDAKTLAIEYVQDRSVATAEPKTQNIGDFLFSIMWKTKKDTILNSDQIDYIVDIENQFINRDYDGYFKSCLSDVDTIPQCADHAINSVFREYSNGTGEEVTDEAIERMIKEIHREGPLYLSSVDLDFETTNKSRYYRGLFSFGLPYPDISETESSFTDQNDDWDKQRELYLDWAMPVFEHLQYKLAPKTGKEDLELVALCGACLDEVFNEKVNEALGFAIFSILIVWIMMMYHMGSFFLATMAMIQIVMGFPFAYFFYRYIFWVPYYDTLSTLIIFVILGIGADDVFVYIDAWEQSVIFVQHPDDLVERMSFTFTRASKAMLVTQLTTFFAFLGTCVSALIPIRAFGLWAALVVMCNYALVITFFPSTLSWWYQNLRVYEKRYCCYPCRLCRCACAAEIDEEAEKSRHAAPPPGVGMPVKSTTIGASEADILDDDDNNPDASSPPPPTSDPQLTRVHSVENLSDFQREIESARMVEKFLGTTFVDTLSKPMYGYTILIFYLGWFILNTVYAAQIEGQSEQEQWFADNHWITKSLNWPGEFYGGALSAQIFQYVMWGPKSRVDRSKVGPWDTEYYGDVRWDDEFDLNPTLAQQHVYDACQTARIEWIDDLYDPDDSDAFFCPIEELVDWVNATFGYTFPYDFDNDASIIEYDNIEEMIYDWVKNDSNGNAMLSGGYVGFVEGDSDEDESTGSGTGTLRYWAMGFNLNEVFYAGTDKVDALYRRFQRRMRNLNQLAEDNGALSVSRGFQTSEFAYANAVTSRAFVSSATQGIALALPLAFVVLIFSTSNWVVSCFAASTIILILVSEVALMVWQGWKLGIGESVSVVIMIGFSVDYVVHLGNAYVECEFAEDRVERMRFSLFTMGISVIFGSLTTFGSGFCLVLPEMFFFRKFGVLIMTTVMYSVVFALTYFSTLMLLFGPEKDYGYVPVWEYVDKYITQPCRKLIGKEPTSAETSTASENNELR